MKIVQSGLAARKSAKFLLALVAMSLAGACATVNSEDEGQTRDRPTGGVG